MAGETDLATLLATMDPQVREGRFVFASVPGPVDAPVQASVVEDEGLSIVVAEEDAARLGVVADFVAGWITLRVHSSLEAVGLTAAVSAVLAESGISCNVIAGFHHDHLLVPHERLDDALELLHSAGSA